MTDIEAGIFIGAGDIDALRGLSRMISNDPWYNLPEDKQIARTSLEVADLVELQFEVPYTEKAEPILLIDLDRQQLRVFQKARDLRMGRQVFI